MLRPLPRAGSSAPRLQSFPAHHVLPRSLSATAAARPECGFSNGVTAMDNSSSQRMLSLWLRRLSTDRIVRLRKHETSAPLVVTGKRGNVEVLTATDDAARRLGLMSGLAMAQARPMHPGIEAVAAHLESDAALPDSLPASRLASQ